MLFSSFFSAVGVPNCVGSDKDFQLAGLCACSNTGGLPSRLRFRAIAFVAENWESVASCLVLIPFRATWMLGLGHHLNHLGIL
jgi:hypothetical protein